MFPLSYPILFRGVWTREVMDNAFVKEKLFQAIAGIFPPTSVCRVLTVAEYCVTRKE